MTVYNTFYAIQSFSKLFVFISFNPGHFKWEKSNSNSKTLFYKDCSLESFKKPNN